LVTRKSEAGWKSSYQWDLKPATRKLNSSSRNIYSTNGLLLQDMSMKSQKDNTTWLSSAGLPYSDITHHRLVVVWAPSSAEFALPQFSKFVRQPPYVLGEIVLRIALPAECGLHLGVNLFPSRSETTARK
jgi:hypothetical protein